MRYFALCAALGEERFEGFFEFFGFGGGFFGGFGTDDATAGWGVAAAGLDVVRGKRAREELGRLVARIGAEGRQGKIERQEVSMNVLEVVIICEFFSCSDTAFSGKESNARFARDGPH